MPEHTPYLANRFRVDIGDEPASVSRVVLPGATAVTVPYATGDQRDRSPQQLVGTTENELLVLERGVSDTAALYEWFDEARAGDLADARRDVTVSILDERHEPVASWVFRDAWPAHYRPPTLDAGANDVAVERFEIAHEGMDRR